MFRMLLLLACTCFTVVVSAQPAERDDAMRVIDRQLSADSVAYPLLRTLTITFPNRLTGTSGGHQAEQFAYDQFKKAGIDDVRFESFDMLGWEAGPLTFEVDGGTLPAVALMISPAESDVTAPIVDLGNGTEADYRADPLRARDKIVLVYAGILPGSPDDTPRMGRIAKTALAIKYGAAGIVLTSSRGDEPMAGTGSVEPIPIPALSVGQADGLALRQALDRRPAKARIRVSNTFAEHSGRNVIATIPGTELPNEYIVVGAHLDAWDAGTGAIDTGVTAMSVIDVARAIRSSGQVPRRSLRFILFSGEEQGEKGSTHHVRRLVEDGELKNVRYMINMDMSIDPLGFNLWGFDADSNFFTDLGQRIAAMMPDFPARIASRAMPGSDGQPYIERGVPVLYLTGRLDEAHMRCQHAACDTLDKIQPAQAQRTSRVLAATLWRLADAQQLPARPLLDTKAIRAYLKSQGMDD